MRKLMETIEQLNEDPTAGGRMRALYNDISELKRVAEQISVDFEKYPQLEEYKIVADQVYMDAARLQRRFNFRM